MKAEVLARLEANQSSIAKKVLTVVPFDSPVNGRQVASRMKEKLGLVPSLAVVEGCLGSMAHVGLLREPDKGFFIRVGAKNAVPAPAPTPAPNPATFTQRIATDQQRQVDAAVDARTAPPVTTPKSAPTEELDLVSQFASITADMRLNGQELIDMANEMDEKILKLSSQLDALTRLKKMFKEMS